VRRVKEGILLEPIVSDVRKWFAELDRLNPEATFPAARKQRKPSVRRYFE
jgi:hypothetical protein